MSVLSVLSFEHEKKTIVVMKYWFATGTDSNRIELIFLA